MEVQVLMLHPTHFFGNPGLYSVDLTVTTENQCTSSYTDTIRVYKTPVVSITGKRHNLH